MVTLEEARARLVEFLATKGQVTDATEYRGVRKDGAWLLTWDLEATAGEGFGAPSYLVLDEDGSVHPKTWREPVEDALRRIRSGT